MSVRKNHSSLPVWLGVAGTFFLALSVSIFFIITDRSLLRLRSSLPPSTVDRPPFIITSNPYPLTHVTVGNRLTLMLASMKSGYVTVLPGNILDTLSLTPSGPLPQGMRLDPVTIDVPFGTSSRKVQVRELTWTPTAGQIGDHTVTLTSSVTIDGTTYQADPVTITFRVFDPAIVISNQTLLANLVSRHLTTASSVQDILATLSFDDVLQNMTSEELLRALVQNNIITRYASYNALVAALPNHQVDLASLKPYGILQALATPPKGGTVLRQKDPAKPWMIVQDAYDDLRAAYVADPFSLLNHYQPHHLLALVNDRIPFPIGGTEDLPVYSSAKETTVAPTIIKKAPLTGRRYTADPPETEAEYRARFPQLAAQIKAQTDAMPPGRRVIQLQGIDRLDSLVNFDGVFSPFRSSTGALIEERGYFPANYDCTAGAGSPACPEGPPTPTGCIDGSSDYKKYHCLFSLWPEHVNPEEDWYTTVRSRLSEFFRIYKSIGGQVDVVITDMETDWYSMYFARRIWYADHEDHLLRDARWLSLAQELIDAGIPRKIDGTVDLTGIKTWFTYNDWKGLLWDAVMTRRLVAMYNEVMFTPIRFDVQNGNNPLFPNIQFTDYEFYHRSNLSPVVSYYGFPKNIASVGEIVGTHPSLDVYARNVTFEMPSGLVTDSPSGPVTFFTNLLFDLKKSRTFPLSSSLPGMVWIAHPYYTRYTTNVGHQDPLFVSASLDEIDDWYRERMFHHGLMGIDAFTNWTGSELDTAIKNANGGSLAEYDRGFLVMEQGLQEINAKIGYDDRTPLVMRPIDFQDGYVLSGMEVHGKRIYRFTPDPDIAHEVRSLPDGSIELSVRGILIKKIPHSTVEQNHKGYWITQSAGNNLLTASVDDVLAALQ